MASADRLSVVLAKRLRRAGFLVSLAMAVLGCQSVSGLDGVRFEDAPIDDVKPCGGCDGRCVNGHCCRNGGTFTRWEFGGGRRASQLRFADVLEGGNLEAVVAYTKTGEVWVHELAATGPFESPRIRATLSDQGSVSDFELGDLDGDGRLDLVTSVSTKDITSPLQYVAVHRGTPTGFEPPTLFDNPYQPGALALLDFDGDGDLDLRLDRMPGFPGAGETGWRRNDGSGGLAPFTSLGTEYTRGRRAGLVPNATLDGRQGILILDDAPTLELPTLDERLEAIALDVEGLILRGGGVADLDGDGDHDLILVTNPFGPSPNSVVTFLRSGTRDLERCETIALPDNEPRMDLLVAGDFDHDGHPDVGGLDAVDEFFPSDKTEHDASRWAILRSSFP